VSFRTGLIVLTLVVLGLMAVYLAWRLVSVRRNPTTRDPENLAPFLDDEGLEGPRLERALGWSLLFVLIVALALPVYFLFEPNRQENHAEFFDEQAAERGATLYANSQSEAYDPTKSLLCANCHGVDGQGGAAPFVLQPELDICDNEENKSNPDVPACLPVQVSWTAPALDTVLLRFPEEEVFQILTWGRPGSPMPAWGVESGKGVLNTQSINDLIAYLQSIQITKDEAQQRSTKAVTQFRTDARENLAQQEDGVTTARADLAELEADPASSAAAIAEARAQLVDAEAVAASAQAWADQVADMGEGEVLFRVNCARCHTKGASYYDPNNLALPEPPPQGSGAFGPNLTGGSTTVQFPGLAGVQEQFDWIALGAPANEGYGVRGISSGRMPYFVNLLSEKQIKAIVAYERSL
jgi:mono/diheme cytochrome c family protein